MRVVSTFKKCFFPKIFSSFSFNIKVCGFWCLQPNTKKLHLCQWPVTRSAEKVYVCVAFIHAHLDINNLSGSIPLRSVVTWASYVQARCSASATKHKKENESHNMTQDTEIWKILNLKNDKFAGWYGKPLCLPDFRATFDIKLGEMQTLEITMGSCCDAIIL